MLDFTPFVPELFIALSQRFGLILAGSFAIMTFAPIDRLGVNPGERKVSASVLLAVMFGLLGVIGTYTGNLVFQSYANLRAMGVVTAGLFGGPLVGLGAGLIAGGHRYLIDVGGFSALPCALATIMEGAAAGMLCRAMPGRALDWRFAAFLCVASETAHMGLVLALSRPFSEAVALVNVIAAPMIVINSLGAAFFTHLLRIQMNLRERRDSDQARQVLAIANQTLGHLRAGLNPLTAATTAAIILEKAGVAAVAVTDGERILAHVGTGADHHLSGEPIRTEATRRAVREGAPIFARNPEEIGCQRPGCRLTEAAIAPLRKGEQVVGCLKLYGTDSRPLDRARFELAKGLAELFSTQIELEDVGIARQLLAQAEIRRLQAQINPHFLFNALNAVASFCRTSPAKARETLLELSGYLRRNLDASSGSSGPIPLSSELAHVESYLAIERARFGDRVQTLFQVEPEALDWPVPPLIVQPLVENALRHGALGREEGGMVRLCALVERRVERGMEGEGSELRVTIEDDGPGMDQATISAILSGGTPGKGIGAANCHERLRRLHGPDHGLEIDSAPGQGARVSFRIPKP